MTLSDVPAILRIRAGPPVAALSSDLRCALFPSYTVKSDFQHWPQKVIQEERTDVT